MKKLELILASQSPRRKELLAWLNIPFKIVSSNIEEHLNPELSPSDQAISLAQQKGEAITKICESDSLIIAADTLVILGEKIFGKPKDKNEAREILRELSGKTHEVITGVSFHLVRSSLKTENRNFFVSSRVSFDPLNEEIMKNYLATNESLDKAGAYGIQGAALTFISQLEGSYSNVVGLPLSDLRKNLLFFLGSQIRPCSRLSDYFC